MAALLCYYVLYDYDTACMMLGALPYDVCLSVSVWDQLRYYILYANVFLLSELLTYFGNIFC